MLNLYIIWRLVDEMWVTRDLNDQDLSSADDAQKFWIRVQQITNIIGEFMSPLILVMYYAIIPAVYEDIKDNIFLVLGGNRNLWDNFYNTTLTKSVLELDIIANFEYWTTLFFLFWNLKDNQGQYPFELYWGLFAAVFIMVQITDLIGYKSVSKSINLYCALDKIHLKEQLFLVFHPKNHYRINKNLHCGNPLPRLHNPARKNR